MSLPAPANWKKILTDFANWLADQEYAAGTRCRYRAEAAAFLAWLGPSRPLDRAALTEYAAFVSRRGKPQNYHVRCALRAFVAFARETEPGVPWPEVAWAFGDTGGSETCILSTRKSGYGLVFLTLETVDGRIVEGSGLTERSAYVNALNRAKDHTPAPAG